MKEEKRENLKVIIERGEKERERSLREIKH